MKKRLDAKVSGRVQGVGFRWFVNTKAKSLGLVGVASNTPHGNVKIIAEGEEASLQEFLEHLRKGPILANVTKLDYSFKEYKGEYKLFEIERNGTILEDQMKVFRNLFRKNES